MQSLLRQSLKPHLWMSANGIKRCVLIKQFSLSSLRQKDDTLPNDIVEGNLPETYATFYESTSIER